jgi:hypothetical protein
MTYQAGPRVDPYTGALSRWQQAISREVRNLVHAADPEVKRSELRTLERTLALVDGVGPRGVEPLLAGT